MAFLPPVDDRKQPVGDDKVSFALPIEITKS
jgi:hypothetical protein